MSVYGGYRFLRTIWNVIFNRNTKDVCSDVVEVVEHAHCYSGPCDANLRFRRVESDVC